MLTDRPATGLEVDLEVPKLLPEDLIRLFISVQVAKRDILEFKDVQTAIFFVVVLDQEAYVRTARNQLHIQIFNN
jgi:hypothetical protein